MEMGCGGLERPTTHISCLYPEILAMIFQYLDVKDKGTVSKVCSSWRDAAYQKSVWRNVEAKLHVRRSNSTLFPSLVRRGIRRVQVLSLRRGLRELLQGVPNLESLNLTGCYSLTDLCVAQALQQPMPTLTQLDVSMCKQLSDSSLNQIASLLSRLEALNLGGCCNITNTGLLMIAWTLRWLRRLNLRSCRNVSDVGIQHLAGQFPQGIVGTPALERLCLQDCQKLTDESLRYLSLGLTHLKSLNLSFCSGISDIGLKHLSHISSLQELNLRSCDNISDIGLSFLAEGSTRLLSLDVSFCDKVGDQGLLHVSQGLFNLQNLSLNACPITDDGISRIVRTLSDLQTLDIGQCSRVTDKGLTLIAQKCHKLTSIDLYGCTNITTVGIEKVMQLPQLKLLNLGLWQRR